MDCKSFDSDRDIGAHIANHLIKIGTSEGVSRIICVQKALIFLNVPDNPDQSECSVIPHYSVHMTKSS